MFKTFVFFDFKAQCVLLISGGKLGTVDLLRQAVCV
jgi:hypothetical protein